MESIKWKSQVPVNIEKRTRQWKMMLGPALRSQQPHAMLQAWGRVAGKLPGRRGPGGAG